MEETVTEPLLRPVMPELDVIRGIAILLVVVHHGIYMPTLDTILPRWEHLLVLTGWIGRLGVNLFFVLSGFLITGILVDGRKREDYYKRFYFRRALRIFPIYFVVLGILLLEGYSKGFLTLSFFYLSNFAPLLGLALEQYYLVARRGRAFLLRLAGAGPPLVIESFALDLRWCDFDFSHSAFDKFQERKPWRHELDVLHLEQCGRFGMWRVAGPVY